MRITLRHAEILPAHSKCESESNLGLRLGNIHSLAERLGGATSKSRAKCEPWCTPSCMIPAYLTGFRKAMHFVCYGRTHEAAAF
jgi:hypothetical protein